jgi:glycosidase
MDFSFYDKINQAMHEDTDGWWHGLNRIYNNFVYDYLYPDPLHIMAFLENHDTDRFLKDSQNSTLLKQAFTLLLTTRRIPQLYYGTEIMMNGTKNKTDGDVRKDFPGGWKEDAQNAFTSEGRTAIQNDMFDFVSKLLHWRKGNDVISKGSMTQFIPFNGVYVYSRSYVGKSVMVILNGKDSTVDMPVARYAEVLPKSIRQGKDVITGKIIDLNGEIIHLQPRESLVVDFDK